MYRNSSMADLHGSALLKRDEILYNNLLALAVWKKRTEYALRIMFTLVEYK